MPLRPRERIEILTGSRPRVWIDDRELGPDAVHAYNLTEGWVTVKYPIEDRSYPGERVGMFFRYYGKVRVEQVNRWEGTLRSVMFDREYVEIEIDTGARGREWRFQIARSWHEGRGLTHYGYLVNDREMRNHMVDSLGAPCVVERTRGEGEPNPGLDGREVGDFLLTVNGRRVR